jgi:hypothetical protein
MAIAWQNYVQFPVEIVFSLFAALSGPAAVLT